MPAPICPPTGSLCAMPVPSTSSTPIPLGYPARFRGGSGSLGCGAGVMRRIGRDVASTSPTKPASWG